MSRANMPAILAGSIGIQGKSERRAVVIVLLDDNEEKATHVKITSIREGYNQARCYEEAALQQHRDMEEALIKVCEMLAQCGLENNVNATILFDRELTRARENIGKLGHKARFRHVDYVPEENL